MKKNILILGLVAFMGLSFVSCSTDDSYMDKKADGSTIVTPDNGDKEFPKPPMKP